MPTPFQDPSSTPLKVRVLIIEDNEDDRDLLFRQLQKAGIHEQVKFIADGKEALAFLLKNPELMGSELMVIFLDLKLPGLSGIEILQKLKGHAALSSIPVVVMTSSNSQKDLDECKKLKVFHYTEKPVDLKTFSASMAGIFQLPLVVSSPSPRV